MAAALSALGDDGIGAAVDGTLGIGTRLQLAEQWNAGAPDASRKRLRVIEGQEDRLRLAGDRTVQQLRPLPQRPGDEAASHRLVAGRGKLPLEPALVIAVAAAKQAQ